MQSFGLQKAAICQKQGSWLAFPVPQGHCCVQIEEQGQEEARVQADASGREPHASGTHRRPGETAAGVPSIIDDIRLLSPRARAAMTDALLPGEQPHVVIPGAGGSAVVGTGERILVIKAGARAGAPFGARAKGFEFESVIGVRLDTSASPAVIAVDAPVKIVSCRVYWADSRDNAWKARNAVPVDLPHDEAAARVDALRGLMEAYSDRHPRPDPSARRDSVVQALPAEEASRPGKAEERPVVSSLSGRRERCPHCRAVLRPGWRYCPGCGAPSETDASAPGR